MFFNLSTINTWGQTILCCERLSCTLWNVQQYTNLYALDASSTPILGTTTQCLQTSPTTGLMLGRKSLLRAFQKIKQISCFVIFTIIILEVLRIFYSIMLPLNNTHSDSLELFLSLSSIFHLPLQTVLIIRCELTISKQLKAIN